MSHTLQVFQTVLAFAIVVLLCVLLKKLAVIKEEHGPLFARLLTQVALPVVIFTQLATHPIAGRQFLLVLAMMVSGTICLAVAWVAGRIMKLERPKIGALMLVSAFGSSALIGYPLIQYAFPGNPQAMQDAILVSELGVGLPIFTLCVWVAMYFGKEFGDASKDRREALLGYFRSPIFIALVAGLLISPLGLNPQQPMLAPFFQASHMVSESITLLSCLILGLQLDLRSVRGIMPVGYHFRGPPNVPATMAGRRAGHALSPQPGTAPGIGPGKRHAFGHPELGFCDALPLRAAAHRRADFS